MKKLLIIISMLIFMSCNTNYDIIDKQDLTIKQYETVVAADTCLVFTDYTAGKSLIYNIKEKEFYKSYSLSSNSTALLL